MEKVNEQVMASSTSKASKVETIEIIGVIDDVEVSFVKADSGYFITYMGLTIRKCPSKVEDVDLKLVTRALNCYLDCISTYYSVFIDYDTIDYEIQSIYASIY